MAAPAWMLDTNALSDLIRNPAGPVAQRLAALAGDLPCTSIVVACELRRWRKKPFAAQTRAEWRAFKAQLQAQAYDAVIDLQGNISYLPYCTATGCISSDTVRVLVAEKSLLDRLLEDIPGVKSLVKPIVLRLHEIPIVRDLLAPII